MGDCGGDDIDDGVADSATADTGVAEREDDAFGNKGEFRKGGEPGMGEYMPGVVAGVLGRDECFIADRNGGI